MELEVDMRGTVRVGALHPRMSAHSSGALSEGDIVLSIDGTKVSGDKIEDSKALLVGKRATMVSIEVERGKQTFSVNLKRGSWGPEHASVSTEQPMAITPKNSAKQNASVREPKPANLQVPSNVLPGGNVRPAWPADNPETEGMKGVQERAAAEAAAAAAAKQAEETRRESGAALEAAEDLDQVIQSRPTATRSRPQSSVGGGGGGGLGGVVVQGSYAAARRSQGSGALASTPE
jgi:membrane-associated protease RseP (regulator of RpoE activity)